MNTQVFIPPNGGAERRIWRYHCPSAVSESTDMMSKRREPTQSCPSSVRDAMQKQRMA